MAKVNEYDGIGFEFDYKNGKLSKTTAIEKKSEETSKWHNKDNISVICKPCNVPMNFNDGAKPRSGSWLCSVCGAKVSEETIYTELEKEQQVFQQDIFQKEKCEMTSCCCFHSSLFLAVLPIIQLYLS